MASESLDLASDADMLALKRHNKLAELLHLVQDPLFTNNTKESINGLSELIERSKDATDFKAEDVIVGSQSIVQLIAENIAKSIFHADQSVPEASQQENSLSGASTSLTPMATRSSTHGDKRHMDASHGNEPPAKILRTSQNDIQTHRSTRTRNEGRRQSSAGPASVASTVPRNAPKPIPHTSKPSHPINSITSEGSSKPANSISIHQEEEDGIQFLDRDLADVDILTVPEHYPTKPHTVSSLAELYYLTQTLPLVKLLPSSHKTLMTENYELAFLEGKIAVLYSRIEELKRQGKWSLRQPIKYKEPFQGNTYWNNVVSEGKWMAADFKESSKYKKACCYMMAQAVSDYWTYGKELVSIKRKAIHQLEVPKPVISEEALVEDEESRGETIPDVVPSNETEENKVGNDEENEEEEDDSFVDAKAASFTEAIDVSELLSTNTDNTEVIQKDLESITALDVNPENVQKRKLAYSPFKLHVDVNDLKKIDQSLIMNLPKFTAFDDETPSTKSASIKSTSAEDSPLTAVSRLLYPLEQDDQWFKVLLKESSSNSKYTASTGPPDYQKGLFGFQTHRRFNSLKPPKPPLIKNIEFRSPTIWLPKDDKYLIHYVAEFCFNWQLISEHLSSSAASMKKYESNIERRTPWQCFERYIQLNEKFQFSDMKGVYSYHAQQWLEQAHKAQSTTKRRISPLGVGNESIQRGHRRLRWASMFDAMRKSMKKRETNAAKITMRRANEYGNSSGSTSMINKRPSDKVPSPAELSRLKYERDKSIQDAYINQQATRSRMMAAVAKQQQQQQQQSQQQGGRSAQGNGAPPTSKSSFTGSSAGGVGPSNTTGMVHQGGVPPNPQLAKPGVPLQQQASSSQQSQTQPQSSQQGHPQQGGNQMMKRPTSPGGTPYTAEQIQQLLQIQKQRRLLQQQQLQQQQQQSQQHQSTSQGLDSHGKPIVGNSSMGLQNTGAPRQLANGNTGMSSGSAKNSPVMQASVPLQQQQQYTQGQRAQPTGQVPGSKPRIHFAPAQVSAIINSIQTKNPNLSKEQVTKLAATYLANLQQQQQQRAQQQQLQQQRAQQQQMQGQGSQAVGNSQQSNLSSYGGASSSAPQQQQQMQRKPNQGQYVPNHQSKQPQLATLTPQERNQLQMLKAARIAQQEKQLQQQRQQQLQQQMQQQNQSQPSPQGQQSPQLSPGALKSNVSSPLNANANMTKQEYEQRKKILIQKQQQQLQLQKQQQLQQQQQQQQQAAAKRQQSGSSSGSSSQGQTPSNYNK